MTDRRPPETKLIEDLVKVKRARDYWRTVAELRAAIIVEQQHTELARALRDRLVRFEYFHEHIGLENVLDRSGRIDWRKVDLKVADLIVRRPELGVSLPPNVGGPT